MKRLTTPFALLLVTTTLQASESLTREQLIEAVAERTASMVEGDGFSGTVLIAEGDEILWTTAVGEASKRFHVSNRLDTKFNLGSMNKMFTSTVVALLAEEGKLTYEDPIAKYVDESWLPKQMTERISVRHLLTHTSGLGSYFNQTYMESSRMLFRAVDDYKPLVQGDTLAFEPGSRYQYSNTGMLLLGVVIEKVTGEDYFEVIRKRIYEPAGMKNSDSYEMDRPVENLAIGYDRGEPGESGGEWHNNIYMHVLKGGPAGGGFSTVEDLHRFALAMLSGELVSVSSLDLLWTDQVGANYGFGFAVADSSSGKIVGHSGGFSGISASLDIHVDQGFIVAVLSNYSQAAGILARDIRGLVQRTAD